MVLFNPLKVFLPLGAIIFLVGVAKLIQDIYLLESVGDGGHGLSLGDHDLGGRPAGGHDLRGCRCSRRGGPKELSRHVASG